MIRQQGIVYGVKVRFPHALVMALIFARGPWQARLAMVYKATKQHALNLAKFVSIYKTVLLLQRTVGPRNTADKEKSLDTFFAGLLGGYFVFGERTAINEQVQFRLLHLNLTRLPERLKRDYPYRLFSTSSHASSLHSYLDSTLLQARRPLNRDPSTTKSSGSLPLCPGAQSCGYSRTEETRYKVEWPRVCRCVCFVSP